MQHQISAAQPSAVRNETLRQVHSIGGDPGLVFFMQQHGGYLLGVYAVRGEAGVVSGPWPVRALRLRLRALSVVRGRSTWASVLMTPGPASASSIPVNSALRVLEITGGEPARLWASERF